MSPWVAGLALGKEVKQRLLDLLFPPHCVGCRKVGDWLCGECLALVQRVLPPLCPHCGRTVPQPRLCDACHRLRSSLDSVRAAAYFEGVLREAVHAFKYENVQGLAGPLGGLLAAYLTENPLDVDVVVPVPLHSHRLRERGYNQSALLARKLAEHTGLPVREDALHRLRATAPQVGLDAASRRENVSGAFHCPDYLLHGQRVLLVDDVYTTGATMDACGAALRQAGAISVFGLTLARGR